MEENKDFVLKIRIKANDEGEFAAGREIATLVLPLFFDTFA